MKKLLNDRFFVLAPLLLFFAAGLFSLFGGKGVFSDSERRYLADPPSAASLENGTFDDATEKYLSDHIPFRTALVALDSTVQVLTGRRTELNAWPVAGSIIEKPLSVNTRSLENRIARFASLADSSHMEWFVLTPPTHGYMLLDKMASLIRNTYTAEETVGQFLNASGHAVSLFEAFSADPDGIYYDTDHHWTLHGAYLAYEALGEKLGFTPLPLSAFSVSSFSPFRGTTLAASGLPALQYDSITCAVPQDDITLYIREEDKAFDHLIFPENIDTYDGYAVYLNGNHGLLEIDHPGAEKGTLIVFKDSFANSLLPLLSAHYKKTVAADARYLNGNFSSVTEMYSDAECILYVYSADSLLNDTEITRKLR